MREKYRRGKNLSVELSFSLCLLLLLVSSLYAQERFRRSPPFPEPLKELNLPGIESDQLSNGLTVTLLRRGDLRVMTMQLIVLTGESSSPEGMPGLATFTANMVTKGAEDLPPSQVEEIMEYIGGKISTSTFLDYSVFTFTFLEEYVEVALDMLSGMILRPSFLRREIDSEKRDMYYEMREKEKDPEYIARMHLLQLLFEGHSYRKTAYREDFIRNISPKDVLDFFHKYYRPDNSILLFIGNLNLNTAFKKTSHYLNTWRNSSGERSSPEPPKPSLTRRVALIDFPQEKDATLYIGNVICFQNTQDFFPFLVLNQVLGGTPNSRLFLNLRESKGYAYYAFSEVELFKMCGVFMIKAKVRPEVIFPSVQESLAELEKTVKEEISSFEIEQAKSYLLGNFPLKIEKLDYFSLNMSKIIAFNLGDYFWNKYYENIMLINAGMVFDVAQKYPIITPVVVIVADKGRVMDYLSEFQKIEVYDSKGVYQYSISKGAGE